MTGTPVRLACLDMAGTTVTDDGAVLDAFTAALATAGIEPPSARFDGACAYVLETMGQSKIAVFTTLFDGDVAAATRANDAFEAAYAASIEGGRVAPMHGAVDAMDELAAHGVQVCLTTGFSSSTRDALIAALGWQERAALVLTPAETGRGRPFPDMILSAVLRLEIDDVRSVVVAGDTVSDLIAGQRAGAGLVVGVLTGAHAKDQLASVAGAVLIDSVADLPGLLFEQGGHFVQEDHEAVSH